VAYPLPLLQRVGASLRFFFLAPIFSIPPVHSTTTTNGHSERSKPTLFSLFRSREGVGLRSRGISPRFSGTRR
jgi:hypothetical protein